METYLYTKSRGCPALLLCVCTASGKPLLVFGDSDHVSTKAENRIGGKGLATFILKKDSLQLKIVPLRAEGEESIISLKESLF